MTLPASAKALIVALVLSGCTHAPPPAQAGMVEGERRVDLTFSNEDVHEAFRTLAQQAQLNFFLDSDIEGRVTLAVHAAPWSEVLTTLARDQQLRVERLSVGGLVNPCFWISRLSSPPAPQTEFTGERVAMKFDETPLRRAVAQLAEAAKTTIVVDDGVDDLPVTLHLRLPWDLGLAHLAQKYTLRLVRTDGIVHVSR